MIAFLNSDHPIFIAFSLCPGCKTIAVRILTYSALSGSIGLIWSLSSALETPSSGWASVASFVHPREMWGGRWELSADRLVPRGFPTGRHLVVSCSFWLEGLCVICFQGRFRFSLCWGVGVRASSGWWRSEGVVSGVSVLNINSRAPSNVWSLLSNSFWSLFGALYGGIFTFPAYFSWVDPETVASITLWGQSHASWTFIFLWMEFPCPTPWVHQIILCLPHLILRGVAKWNAYTWSVWLVPYGNVEWLTNISLFYLLF